MRGGTQRFLETEEASRRYVRSVATRMPQRIVSLDASKLRMAVLLLLLLPLVCHPQQQLLEGDRLSCPQSWFQTLNTKTTRVIRKTPMMMYGWVEFVRVVWAQCGQNPSATRHLLTIYLYYIRVFVPEAQRILGSSSCRLPGQT